MRKYPIGPYPQAFKIKFVSPSNSINGVYVNQLVSCPMGVETLPIEYCLNCHIMCE
jgi:hypothetical protein